MNRKGRTRLLVAGAVLVAAALGFAFKSFVDRSKEALKSKVNFITFSRIDKAQEVATGEGVKVAVCDWLFDLRGGPASEKYINPESMIPGEPVGAVEPWHGEWMAELVHQTAPACKIIPIRTRTHRNDYQQYLVKGIRFAADQGAVAVTCSMGPLVPTDELREAVNYAEAKGTIFINVHPIKRSACGRGEIDEKIICTGVVSVSWHPATLDSARDICVWPYSLKPTASTKDGFRVLDAEAALLAAIHRRP